jgi:hypothetical protein
VKYSFIYIGALLGLLTACRQPGPSATTTAPVSGDSTQKNFFPVADYIRGEMRYVDSMPLALLKYTVRDNRTDSGFIHADEFHRIAGEFLLPGLAKENFEKNFSQSSFMDETSGYLTFTYSTLDKDQPLQRVDVLALPAAAGTNTNQVKSIFLQTSSISADTVVVKKMLWIAKESLLVITSLQPRNKPAIVSQVKVVWDSGPTE